MDAEVWVRQCVNRAQQVPMDEVLKANYLADLAILSGLVYKSETIMTIISEETMYKSSIIYESSIGQSFIRPMKSYVRKPEGNPNSLKWHLRVESASNFSNHSGSP